MARCFNPRRKAKALLDSFVATVYIPDASVTVAVSVWRAPSGYLRAIYPTP